MREEESSDNLARAIYGTILSTALVVAYSEDPGSDPLQVAAAVLTASLVFWIAHAYADLLASEAIGERAFTHLREELGREWPLVLGSIPPLFPLLLAPLGILSDDHAETVAIATGIAVLGGWGVAIPLRRGEGAMSIVLGALTSLVFGLAVVALKALVH